MNDEVGTFDTDMAKQITLAQLQKVFSELGVVKLYAKSLSANDNSKNQPYFGTHLADLSFLPKGEITPSVTSSTKTSDPKRKVKYQVSIDMSWIDASGQEYPAPKAKLIYYPQYPEVRFSGFLQSSNVNAGCWMDPNKKGRTAGRWLIIGITPNKKIVAYLVTPAAALSKELLTTSFLEINGVFKQIDSNNLFQGTNSREVLISTLLGIHQQGWIKSQKLNSDMSVSPYTAQNGGGYTLEAKLGIAPNGFSGPDFLGWEVKQFGVTRFPCLGTKPTTLMTPEPDGGIYVNEGATAFVKKYGYADKSGVSDRLNFGGRHITGRSNSLTNLTLNIQGFNRESDLITDASGAVVLLDSNDNIAASWSFAKLMGHWQRKHAQAVYIPCMRRKNDVGEIEYFYGSNIELGIGTDFSFVLSSMFDGNVIYDPGIKLELASSDKPRLKRRSQFRVNHRHLNSLYEHFEFLDIALPDL